MEEERIKEEEQEQPYGKLAGATTHFKISRRDTLVNDFKNSTIEGALSFGFSLVSALILLAGIFFSYRRGGEAGYIVGLVMIISGLFAGTSVVLSSIGFRRKDKVRHYMEKRGLVISIIVIALLTALFARGLYLTLA